MKRIFVFVLVIMLIASVGITAFACSNVNQLNYVSVVARDYEQYTFTVQSLNEQGEPILDIGTMTYTFRRIVAEETINIGGKDYTQSEGGLITNEVTITKGDYKGDTIVSTLLFKGAYGPVASYKEYRSDNNQRAYTSELIYGTGKEATLTVNGKSTTFKKGANCFDNESLYMIVRGSDLSLSNYALTMAGVDNLNGGTRTVSVAITNRNATIEVPFLGNTETSATKVALTAKAEYGQGTITHVFFANNTIPYVNNNGESIKLSKVPLRIEEGSVRYTLSAISTDPQ